MEIGFIGLGNMGAPMAGNLAAAGHAVTGFDLAGVAVEGVARAGSATGAASGCDLVITMLPDGDAVRAVHAEIIPVARPGALIVDCSTVDLESARAVAALAAAAGLEALDAPVSGGSAGAAAATLTFMVGGPEGAFARALPIFEAMGSRAVHCGGSGAGQAAKICNNMIAGATMVAVCEGFSLAEKLGLDPRKFYDVVSTSSGSCWSVTSYCPVPGVGPVSPADDDYRPGFAAELMLKDMRLSQRAAAAVAASTPLAAQAADLYESLVKTGGRGRDFSAIYPVIAARGRE